MYCCLDIIRAFSQVKDRQGWKLVLVCSGETDKKYVEQIKSESKLVPDIVIIETTNDEMLAELFSSAGFFVSTSYYEACPTYLITAISYNLPVIASSIEANVVTGKEYPYYYPQGNIFGLTYYLKKAIQGELRTSMFDRRELISEYDWSTTVGIIEDVYLRLSTV